MLSWRSGSSSMGLDDTRVTWRGSAVERRSVLVGAVVVVFTGGTVGFMLILDESWHSALYRTIVTASLTGLDSTPRGLGAEALTIAIVLSGVAIFGYFAAQIFDSIAHEILGGARKEKKRRRMIDQLRDHIIVCGYGRVGRRAAEELTAFGHSVRRARLQPRRDRVRPRRSATSSSRGAGPRTRTSSARGSTAQGASCSRPTTTPTTCTSRSRRSRAGRR